ncbi:MAG: hypothetical protein LUC85_05350 [Bacteroidales bacterium]|nr:hypothetical protein [Bacteroidales bacterium]MCD8394246.1 hypothetical protein [Bacteroidales bacterium]
MYLQYLPMDLMRGKYRYELAEVLYQFSRDYGKVNPIIDYIGAMEPEELHAHLPIFRDIWYEGEMFKYVWQRTAPLLEKTKTILLPHLSEAIDEYAGGTMPLLPEEIESLQLKPMKDFIKNWEPTCLYILISNLAAIAKDSCIFIESNNDFEAWLRS